ncbi:hypothetical protein GCM10025772_12580 [Ferrimonas gelatinilytica]|uniref:Uncharacterized protein n=1 Tax=Ferrimonas gelatinilytica TaxID=1255257 RepID=A0ABP9S1B6_9GAMM
MVGWQAVEQELPPTSGVLTGLLFIVSTPDKTSKKSCNGIDAGHEFDDSKRV